MALSGQQEAAMRVAAAVAEAIRDLGEVPSGHLYARLMGMMSHDTYEVIIDALVRSGLVARGPMHLLKWVGPN
jgi:hypothetical protein